MKTYITAAICVGAALLAGGCDPSPPAVKAPVVPAKVDVPSVPKTAPSEAMTRLKEPAFGGVDAIDGVTLPKASTVVEITGDKIRIAGNYVDAVHGDAAAGVIAMIGDKPFVAGYGGERPDIASALNNPKYLKSQFYVEIPASSVGKGLHDVKMRVIASDRSGYYESGVVAKLDVK
jgi:hypothetical protein